VKTLEKIAFYLGYINGLEKKAIAMPKAPNVGSIVSKDSNLRGETHRIKAIKPKLSLKSVSVKKGVPRVPKPALGGAPITNPKMGKELRNKRPPVIRTV
jgi:hypothetical protein